MHKTSLPWNYSHNNKTCFCQPLGIYFSIQVIILAINYHCSLSAHASQTLDNLLSALTTGHCPAVQDAKPRDRIPDVATFCLSIRCQ